ncbi:hypothetical protein RFI_23770, partial [Reticulomyxa filosa]
KCVVILSFFFFFTKKTIENIYLKNASNCSSQLMKLKHCLLVDDETYAQIPNFIGLFFLCKQLSSILKILQQTLSFLKKKLDCCGLRAFECVATVNNKMTKESIDPAHSNNLDKEWFERSSWTEMAGKFGGILAVVGGVMAISIRAYKNNQQKQWIDFYSRSRQFIAINPSQSGQNSTKQGVRVMTYNILGDGPFYALSKNHDHCPKVYRKWKYRLPRLLSEIKAYDADILCLQE